MSVEELCHAAGINYLPGEFDAYVLRDIASKGLGVCDLASGRIEPHPNPDLLHLFIVCPTPDGKSNKEPDWAPRAKAVP